MSLSSGWGRTIKEASRSLMTVKGGVDFLYNPFTNIVQVRMGGEWWSDKLKGTGRYILKHRKERVDPAYRPVQIIVEIIGSGDGLLFDVSGGFGYEAAFYLSFR